MHPGPLRCTVAQPCEKYFVKVAALHERIRAMRTEGMIMRAIAERDPEARIALVGATLGEARSVMVEGVSGLLAVAPWWARPAYAPALRTLTWPNGAQARLFGAAELRLGGVPDGDDEVRAEEQVHLADLDELAAFLATDHDEAAG